MIPETLIVVWRNLLKNVCMQHSISRYAHQNQAAAGRHLSVYIVTHTSPMKNFSLWPAYLKIHIIRQSVKCSLFLLWKSTPKPQQTKQSHHTPERRKHFDHES